jgi:phytoene synthase
VARQLDLVFDGGLQPDPVLAALADTVVRYELERDLFDAFLHSMRMDLHITEYATHAELAEYIHGSACVIGLQMLPVLGTVVDLAEAASSAAALGEAFQLTNFLRDIGEDLDRGRMYLPTGELAAYGVDRELLEWCRYRGLPDRRVRRALAGRADTGVISAGGHRDFLAAQGIPLLCPYRGDAVRRNTRRDRRTRLRRAEPAGGGAPAAPARRWRRRSGADLGDRHRPEST